MSSDVVGAVETREKASAMREQIGALLGQGLGRGNPAEELECRCEPAEIPDDVHELGDGVHEMVVAPGEVGVAA